MKTLVIGIDALDGRLVDRWRLAYLRLQERGPVTVPINKERKEPLSPEVWATFLAGKHVALEFMFQSDIPFATHLHRLGHAVGKVIRPRTGLFLAAGRAAGIRMRFPLLKERTFLDDCSSAWVNNPFRDFTQRHPHHFSRVQKCVEGHIPYPVFLSSLQEDFSKDRRDILAAVRSTDADLLFCYLPYLDHLQHVFFKDEQLLRQGYGEMDQFVRDCMAAADARLILVIADHGMQDGHHTSTGYYASSRALDIAKPGIQVDIRDFYDVILASLDLPTRVENKTIAERLSALGYFT
ncbi:hypothetical protein AUJ68_07205 [Candidatus Woesearchaeota archaeon CG1_02_57_44]|nr:MAG: hypothetical protein AUJ68_07205 [Candidatus Woesearchaeota archaeon CG1_02_57_44]PIN69802.1 MAG: hypothetical protein COV94_02525 [Candidatus Woesearchaeota archaeon CG11_big_fil_rev_8_21_14_0_20_57_5]